MKLVGTLRNKFNHLPQRHKPFAILIIITMSVLLILLGAKGINAIAAIRKAPIQPLLIRQGDKILIPPHSALRTGIVLQTVKKSSQPHKLIFPGVVEENPANTINILAPFSGKLISLHAGLGEVVKKDQLLVEMSSPDFGQINSSYAKAQSQLNLTSLALKRTQEVYRAGGSTIKDVQLAQNDYNQAAADLKQLQLVLTMLGKNKRLKIRSPIDGRITALNYGQGAFINDITVPLFTISNITSVWVTANIPETIIGIIKEKQKVTVYMPAYPEQKLEAEVSFVNAFLEPDTRRNKTRITFPNPHGKLQPNMFASVHIDVVQPNLIMIPVSAILMDNDNVSVFVETSPWTFERREIELGLEDNDQVRVLSGLKEGERIVVSGGVFIND